MISKIAYTITLGRNGKPTSKGYLVQVEAYQDGKRAYFSTHVHLRKDQFSGGLVVNHPLADKYNAYLYKLRNEIEDVELGMIASGKACSLQALKTAVRDNVSATAPLSDFAASVIGASGRCGRTKDSYRTTLRSVEAFHPGATIHDIDYDWLCRWQAYLTDERRLSHNTVVGRLRGVRCVINEAVRRKLLPMDANPFNVFHIPSMRARRGYLTIKELDRLARAPLDGREGHIRDAFLFSAYTGLRYSDIVTLRNDHVRSGWIVKRMEKTGVTVRIPYRDVFDGRALAVMGRYGSVEELCAIGHNASANKTLRAVTQRVLGKPVTMHVGRHSFASNLVALGVPITTVQKLLGHKKISTTMVYGEVSTSTIERDIRLSKRRKASS